MPSLASLTHDGAAYGSKDPQVSVRNELR